MRIWLGLVLAFALIGSSAARAQPVAELDSGRVAGERSGDVERFLGIPYAAPPVGDLRWRAPRPPAPWTGLRPAVSYSADCMQNPLPQVPWKLQPISEDCLYLNVWKPADAKRPLPVMVWIYGGGFTSGSGAWPVYEGSNLARKGVILVTFNYRLNRFGFFAHPALMGQAAEEPVANYGLMDQVAALKWVRRNIAAFGGDPGNVTIFGESAGGFSVNYLLTMPAARGLFAKAIVESGGGGAHFRMTRSLDRPGVGAMGPQPSALEAGRAYIASLGVTDPTPAALRAIPAKEILGASAMGDGSGAPVIDGRLVVEDPVDAFAAGRQARVPFIIGSNTFEASILSPAAIDGMWRAAAPIQAKIAQLYDGYGTHQPKLVTAEFVGDAFMGQGARNLARLMSGAGAPTWLYKFDHVIEPLRSSMPGTMHGGEMGFVFGTWRSMPFPAMPGDAALSETVMGYWTQFAKTGDPNGPGLPAWPAYSAGDDSLLLFTNAGPVVRSGYHRERLDVIDQLPAP